jgi:hypothetical protein
MRTTLSWLWPYPNLPLGAFTEIEGRTFFLPYETFLSRWHFFAKRKMLKAFKDEQSLLEQALFQFQQFASQSYQEHFSTERSPGLESEWRGLEWWKGTATTIQKTLQGIETNNSGEESERTLPFFFTFGEYQERPSFHLQLSDLDIVLTYDEASKTFWLLCDRQKDLSLSESEKTQFRQSFGHFSREMLDTWTILLGFLHQHFLQKIQ